jgi:hypothetical protein
LVRVRALVIKAPTVLSVGLAGIEPFFIPVVNRPLQKLRTVIIHVVVLVAAIVRVRGISVIVIREALEPDAIALQPFPVPLMEPEIIQPPLVLELSLSFSPPAFAV